MQTFDKIQMLESMVILTDTREQPTDRAAKRYEAFKFPHRKATLSYGDYAYNAQLPNGEWLYDESKTIEAGAVVERKMNLDELASCLTRFRERFEREFKRAWENGANIFLVVENANWEALLSGKYRSRFNPSAFFGSLTSWIVRYDIKVIFCKEELSGRLIREFLYRDLRDRIEKGEFDEYSGD